MAQIVKIDSKIGARFIKFCVVGGSGFCIQTGIFWLLTRQFQVWDMFALGVALLVTTITNFTLNLIWTFK